MLELEMKRPRLFLIDSFGFIFRAYHARARSGAPPMRTTTGISTEAVYIFHNMVRKLRADLQARLHRRDFRIGQNVSRRGLRELQSQSHRDAARPAASRFPTSAGRSKPCAFRCCSIEGFEADDVIGALARRGSEDSDVVIVSSDKDMLQLVNDRVHMYNPMKNDIWYDPATAEQFMGVKPSQVADLLALKGDYGGQHSRRSGHRRKRRARFDPALRIGGSGASSTPPKWSARPIARACRTIASRFC